ncbi:hypothetical protein [Mycolicibacter minnesotensis]
MTTWAAGAAGAAVLAAALTACAPAASPPALSGVSPNEVAAVAQLDRTISKTTFAGESVPLEFFDHDKLGRFTR